MLIEIQNREEYNALVAIMELDTKTKKAMRAALNAFLFCDRKWDLVFVRAILKPTGEQNIFLHFAEQIATGCGPIEYKLHYRPYLDDNNKMVRKSVWEKKEMKRLSGGGTGTTTSSISLPKIREELGLAKRG